MHEKFYLRNEFNFWNVHGIMNTSDLLQTKSKKSKDITLSVQETQSIHDSMNRPKIELLIKIKLFIINI